MIYFPSCKINLGLHILSKYDDGYHEIETGMLEIPFKDVLEIVPATDFAFTASGLIIPGTKNTCIDAFRLFQQLFGIPNVHIHLHKIIPMGGGLGGGSADGAQTLVLLNQLFNLQLSSEELKNYASQLGSDCPFFIEGGFQLAKGRGELLEPLPIQLPHFNICLINLGIHISTQEAYGNVTPFNNRPELKQLLELPVTEWKTQLVNDFEQSAFRNHSALRTVKKELYDAGAVYAAMSGSGSTLFGLFNERPKTIAWVQKPEYEVWL